MKVPELKPGHLALKRAYHSVFSQPDAEPILEDLNFKFNGSPLHTTHKIEDMSVRFAFAAGAREVLLHIDKMMREKDATTT